MTNEEWLRIKEENSKYDNKVLADCNKVLESNPRHRHALIKRGLAYANMGDWEKALADLEKYAEMDPADKRIEVVLEHVRSEIADRRMLRVNDLKNIKSLWGKISNQPSIAYICGWLLFIVFGVFSLISDLNQIDFFEGFFGFIKLIFLVCLSITLIAITIYFERHYKG